MLKYLIPFCLLSAVALAQQQPLTNPQEQIEKTIGSLFVANTNLTAQLQQAQIELAKAQARIKELEAKPEEKK